MAGALLDLDSDRAIKLLSSIGAPSVDRRDIEWANDLDAGKLLLGWLSNQISGDDESNLDARVISQHNETDDDSDTRDAGLSAIAAAMRDSTLESEEVVISNDERVSQYLTQSQDITGYGSDYVPPSQLRKHAKFIASETSNVQQEADMYRARISQTKEASIKINNSIKMLQRAIYDLNTKLRGSEETLSELSIIADTTIAATITGSQELLLELGASPQKEKESTLSLQQTDANLVTSEYADLEAARNILLKSKGDIAILIEKFQESTTNFDQLSQQDASKAADLQMEAGRLQSAFNDVESTTRTNVGSSSGLGATLNQDVIAELQVICDTLEKEVSLRDKGQAEASGGALDSLLSELHEGYIADKQGAKSQRESRTIHDQLRQAWMLDQVAILQLHEEALDEALLGLNSALAPLEKVYSSLSRLARCVQEVDAILEAYAEELGDIYLTRPQSKEKEDQKQRNPIAEEAQVMVNDVEMEQRLRDVLNDCKDRRPAGAGPLVLLTREDILAELYSLKARSALVEGSEKAWADTVIQKNSIRPIHPLLPQIYAHAPTNTSPPFAFPAHVRALEARARSRAAELQGLAQAVDEEVREAFAKEAISKKLDAFVEKWASIGQEED